MLIFPRPIISQPWQRSLLIPFPQCRWMVSRLVWSIDELRPMQMDALLRLFDPSKTKRKLLENSRHQNDWNFVKGHSPHYSSVTRADGRPGLKFMQSNADYGAMEVHNLDEQVASSSAIRKRPVNRMMCLSRRIATTVFLFASPQFLAHHSTFVNALIKSAAKNRTLRSISTDEARMFSHSQHGSVFDLRLK